MSSYGVTRPQWVNSLYAKLLEDKDKDWLVYYIN